MRTFGFGGGVQSMGVLVLAAQGKLQYDHFVFCNVGEDSEDPLTLQYLREIAEPYAEEHGLNLVELRHPTDTVLQRIKRTKKSVVIPAFMNNGMPASRSCTADFKVRIHAKWLKEQGATVENPAITGLGISTDEMQRMKNDSGFAWQQLEYPLIDLRLSRHQCMSIIERAGLPIPPKSACWFCPHHKMHEWRRMATDRPELFARACEVERTINMKYADTGDAYHLHRSKRPLAKVVGLSNAELFENDDDLCESGFCMT